uniref:Uncharacterized protein LOC113793333 n=1 Tax=Dermatophagoides pteronyssinus TaxID=6956 RepID=A0A6P6Y101_DERPT|nr:uncharacterized protein LOC113793333 [Dermatophagoides pteronyssinus]
MIVAFDVRCTIIIRIIIVFTSSSWLPGAGHLFPGFPPSTILNYSEFREKFCVLFLFFVYIVCMCKSGPMLSWSLSFVSSITNKFFFFVVYICLEHLCWQNKVIEYIEESFDQHHPFSVGKLKKKPGN